MGLTPGARVGPYEVVEPIGSGGMGEVYRATDTKLGRDVAINALPSALAADPFRLACFEREAKLAVSAHAEPGFAVGNPQLLFEGEGFSAAGGRTYDVSPDGERFLMIRDVASAASAGQIVIVQNWLNEIERLAPTE